MPVILMIEARHSKFVNMSLKLELVNFLDISLKEQWQSRSRIVSLLYHLCLDDDVGAEGPSSNHMLASEKKMPR